MRRHSTRAEVAAAVDLAVSEFGRLDVMFNNAGIVGAVGRISEMPVEAWDNTIDILLRGVFLGVKHAARVMLPQNSGVIINTSSTAGVLGGLGPHAYTAAKHGVIGLTKSVANELAPNGIRVNAISPGNTVTAMTASVTSGDPNDLEGTNARIASMSPLGYAGLPADIAAAALYLASDDARYVVGAHAGRRRRPDHRRDDAEPDQHRFEPSDPRSRADDMTEDAAQLDAQSLATLLDERAIVAVATRYCRALDTKDWSALDTIFLPDANADLASTSELIGRDAIVDRIRSALSHLDDSQHLVGNHEVHVDGDSATHRCYLQAQHVRRAAAGGPNYLVGGRYEDRLVRTAEGWRIAYRTLVVMWTDGNLAVARGD